MERKIFEPEHNAFRETARRFYEKECLPNRQQWEHDGVTSREVWLRAGELGLLGWEAPEKYGGQGLKDFRYNAILTEEKHATGAVGPGLGLQNDVMPSYLIGLTTEEQKERWLPGYVSGEIITAIAMSEPGAGSDLAGIRTTAVRDGDHYVVNGAKTFISSGILADLVVTVVKTDPRQRATRGSRCWRSSAACRASSAAGSWTRSGSGRPTPPSSPSPTCAFPWRTSSARRIAASTT